MVMSSVMPFTVAMTMTKSLLQCVWYEGKPCFSNRVLAPSELQTYPDLQPPRPWLDHLLGCLPQGAANLCRFVPVRSSQTRAWGCKFVHVCFGVLGRLVQVGANLDGFGAL